MDSQLHLAELRSEPGVSNSIAGGSQSVVPRPGGSAKNLEDMHILGNCPRTTELENWGEAWQSLV